MSARGLGGCCDQLASAICVCRDIVSVDANMEEALTGANKPWWLRSGCLVLLVVPKEGGGKEGQVQLTGHGRQSHGGASGPCQTACRPVSAPVKIDQGTFSGGVYVSAGFELGFD